MKVSWRQFLVFVQASHQGVLILALRKKKKKKTTRVGGHLLTSSLVPRITGITDLVRKQTLTVTLSNVMLILIDVTCLQ